MAAPLADAPAANLGARNAPLVESGVSRPPTAVRVLVFTSLFPSEARPRHGIFVETRLTHLLRDCPIDARVIAPVPWFPSSSPRFGSYGLFAATPRRATRATGVDVTYPRYAMLPRIGVPFQPGAMARAALADLRRLRESGWVPQLIDAHYLYPDGVAAAWLAERLQVPFVMTARGTDVNVLASLPGPGRRIAWAASRASAVVTVSQSLKDRLIALGVDGAKIAVLRNGVDMQVFDTADRRAARERLGLAPEGRLLLCVGNLLPEKDQALALQCLKRLPHERLLIVGDGPLRAQLAATARQLGIEARVLFRGAMPQAELRYAYAAADALLLTSTREGWPNVVLESLACGTPVVACDVGAVREIITDSIAGSVVTGREVQDFTNAIAQVLSVGTSPARLRQHAAQFDWASISHGQHEIFTRAIARAPA